MKFSRKKVRDKILIFTLIFGWVFSGWPPIWQNLPFPPEVQEVEASVSTVTSGFPGGSSYVFTTEQVGGSDAHVLILTNPGDAPDYKWQFLTGGVRLFIDRNAGAGFVQLISQIQTAPEYMKQQGPTGNFVWRSYGLSIDTSGANVLQGFDKQSQADGSVKLVRTHSTFEEGIAEALTETWTIPASAEDLGNKGPKATYAMTKNRGIILTKGVQEGTWRMRWALSGIADIAADNSNIKDSENWAIRKKSYSNNEFTIDVDDFDNLMGDLGDGTGNHTFSEIGTNNKAEILFYKNGTIGERVVDPTMVTLGASTRTWGHSERDVFFNGQNFFMIYSGIGSLVYKASSDNVTWTATSTLISNISFSVTSPRQVIGVYLVSDSKFDVVYSIYESPLANYKVVTCTISGQTINCGNPSAVAFGADYVGYGVAVARTPSSNRIFMIINSGNTDNELRVYSADQTGDAENITSWTGEVTTEDSNITTNTGVAIVPYNNADKVLVIYSRDPGGPGSDGVYSRAITRAGGAGSSVQIGNLDNIGTVSVPVRISDTDFRYILKKTVAAGDSMVEYTWNNSSWSSLGAIDAETDQEYPSLFYDSVSGDLYAFSLDTGTAGDSVERHYKPSGGSWQTEVVVDAGEGSPDRSLPITQMHEPAATSTIRDATQLTWAYRAANGSLFNLMFGNSKLNDLSWSTGSADFEIWTSSSLTWDAGTLLCSGTLTDTNTDTVSCSSGSVAASTQYRVQILLKNSGAATSTMASTTSNYIEHKSIKGASSWAGSNPTLGTCGFKDIDSDDGSTACALNWSGNDARITNTGNGNIILGTSGGGAGTEGFMYMITTSSAVPSSDSGNYVNASFAYYPWSVTTNPITMVEDSSKITITGSGGAASLTFVVSTNNFPNITSGTAVFATTTLSVDTDNSTGWNVTVARNDSDTTIDLDTDATINITDQTAWVPGAATTTAGNAVRISSLDSSGDVLAMRVMTASGTQAFKSTSWWGTTDAYIDSATTLWAGFNSTAKKIGDSSISCSGANCALNTVLYYLDVPSTQKTGVYSGGITYTATMNP